MQVAPSMLALHMCSVSGKPDGLGSTSGFKTLQLATLQLAQTTTGDVRLSQCSKRTAYLCPQLFSRINLYFFKPVGSANCSKGLASDNLCVVKQIYARIDTNVHTAAFEVPGIGRTLAFLQGRQALQVK